MGGSFPLQRNQIAFLYIGDTVPVFRTDEDYFRYIAQFTELQMVAEVTPVYLRRETSVDSLTYVVDALTWIEQHYDQFAGFVVLLPRERALYCSQLMDLMVQKTGKPIVCTVDYPAGQPGGFRDYNAVLVKSVFLFALQVASSNLSGVALVSGQEVVPPTLAVVDDQGAYPVIRSAVQRSLYGRIDFGFVRAGNAPVRSDSAFGSSLFAPDVVSYLDIDKKIAQRVAEAMASERSGVIVDGGSTVPLSAVAKMPQEFPILFVADDTAQLLHDGSIDLVPAPTKTAAASRFAWLSAQNPKFSHAELLHALREWNTFYPKMLRSLDSLSA